MDPHVEERIVGAVMERFSGDSGGHDVQHTLRVRDNAVRIWSEEGGDRDIIVLAALLHDVDDRKLFGGDPRLCTHARMVMGDDFDDRTKDAVCEIIRNISFKGTGTSVPGSIEGRIVQDADRLDAIGAIGIARTFAYGGSRGRNIYDPGEGPRYDMDEETYFTNEGSSINHFHEKLLLLLDLLNTDSAKRIGRHRHEFMEAFLEEFYQEIEGER